MVTVPAGTDYLTGTDVLQMLREIAATLEAIYRVQVLLAEDQGVEVPLAAEPEKDDD